MAEVNPFSEIGSNLFEGIFSGIVVFGGVIIALGVIGFVMWYYGYYRKQFDIKVIIKSDRFGTEKLIEDKAAIMKDKETGTKKLLIWGLKISLPVPPFSILQKTNKGDLIEIWRKSEDEFIYLTPGSINKKYIVRQDGKEYPVAQIQQKQVEGDIAYWNVKRKLDNKGMFHPESILMKLLPYIPQIIGGMITVFVLYILLDSLPQILSELQQLTRELRSLKTAELTRQILPLLKWIP